jgi:hypothetical protein
VNESAAVSSGSITGDQPNGARTLPPASEVNESAAVSSGSITGDQPNDRAPCAPSKVDGIRESYTIAGVTITVIRSCTVPKPLYWWGEFDRNSVCNLCDSKGGSMLDCARCNIVFHARCISKSLKDLAERDVLLCCEECVKEFDTACATSTTDNAAATSAATSDVTPATAPSTAAVGDVPSCIATSSCDTETEDFNMESNLKRNVFTPNDSVNRNNVLQAG